MDVDILLFACIFQPKFAENEFHITADNEKFVGVRHLFVSLTPSNSYELYGLLVWMWQTVTKTNTQTVHSKRVLLAILCSVQYQERRDLLIKLIWNSFLGKVLVQLQKASRLIMDSTNSTAGTSENAITGQRIYEKEIQLSGSDFLKFFKDERFCDVALTTDDGKR